MDWRVHVQANKNHGAVDKGVLSRPCLRTTDDRARGDESNCIASCNLNGEHFAEVRLHGVGDVLSHQDLQQHHGVNFRNMFTLNL